MSSHFSVAWQNSHFDFKNLESLGGSPKDPQHSTEVGSEDELQTFRMSDAKRGGST